jgi:hypothetical protein
MTAKATPDVSQNRMGTVLSVGRTGKTRVVTRYAGKTEEVVFAKGTPDAREKQ